MARRLQIVIEESVEFLEKQLKQTSFCQPERTTTNIVVA